MVATLNVFEPQLWIEALSEVVRENYLVKNYSNLKPEMEELTQKKYFAFKVDDIAGCQKSKEKMKECAERCLVAINLSLDTEFLSKVSSAKNLRLDFNFKFDKDEIEILRLQDSFDSAIRGLVRYDFSIPE